MNHASNEFYNTVSNFYTGAKRAAAVAVLGLASLLPQDANAERIQAPETSTRNNSAVSSTAPTLLRSLYNIQATHQRDIGGVLGGYSKRSGADGFDSGVSVDSGNLGLLGRVEQVSDSEKGAGPNYFKDSNTLDHDEKSGALTVPFDGGSLTGLFSRNVRVRREEVVQSGQYATQTDKTQHVRDQDQWVVDLGYEVSPGFAFNLIGGKWKTREKDSTATENHTRMPTGVTIDDVRLSGSNFQEDGTTYGLGMTFGNPNSTVVSGRVLWQMVNGLLFSNGKGKVFPEDRAMQYDLDVSQRGFHIGATGISGNHVSAPDHNAGGGGRLGVWGNHAGFTANYADTGFSGAVNFTFDKDDSSRVQSSWQESQAVQGIGLRHSLVETLARERNHSLLRSLDGVVLSFTADGIPGDSNIRVGTQLLLPFNKYLRVGLNASADPNGEHGLDEFTGGSERRKELEGRRDIRTGLEAVLGLKNGKSLTVGGWYNDSVPSGDASSPSRQAINDAGKVSHGAYVQLEIPWGGN